MRPDSAGSGQNLVIWGCSGHARVLLDLIGLRGDRVAVFVDARPVPPLLPGVPLLVGEAAFIEWMSARPGNHSLAGVIAIGRQGPDRLRVLELLAAQRVALPVLVHPMASVSPTAVLGQGTQVLAQAVVAAGAVLGDACIINHRASVDHECQLGDSVTVAPGATLCGNVRVGCDVFIGAGATVLPHIRIGEGAMVGAGAVVTRDVAPWAVVTGNPARSARMSATTP